MTVKPTKIFYNAKIQTLDPALPVGEAMALADDRILAIGKIEEILALASEKTERVDLAGQVVIPGFNDSHMHLINWGQSMDGVDLTKAGSLQDLIALGLEFTEQNQDRKWILGRGFNDHSFSPQVMPTRYDLDEISLDRPVVFTRVCGHVCAVNSKALKLAGISKDTPDPAGGSIDRDPLTREPSGILRENAMALVRGLIPAPAVDDLKRVIRKACHSAASLGLTTVQSNDLHGAATLHEHLEAYRQLVEAGELPIRVNLQATMATPGDLRAYLEVIRSQPDLGPELSLGPLKLFADGSLGARTAALSLPYADDPSTSGLALHTQIELDELVQMAAAANLQVAIHAIGDGALDMVLTSYEKAKKANPNWAARPRIIHCQITRPDQLERMSKMGILADIQPIFVPTDLHFVEQRVGPKRAKTSYAWQTMAQLGIRTAGGSDCPVESANPLWGLHAAITRQDRKGQPPASWLPEERLSHLDALSLFTTGSAYATHEEDLKGSLTPGKLADFVVLPADPTEVPAEKLLTMEVTATYVGGCCVFSRMESLQQP